MSVKAGDVVVLKSGSHPMTVQWVNRDGTTAVVWEDKDGAHHTASYNEASLAVESTS
jgi:uncharacterized protein YodC (DUF2158 family)